MKEQNVIILFDGYCKLCNGTVDFLLRRDRKKQFQFVPLQSESGKLYVQKFKIPINTDSVILIRFNQIYFESDAVIEITSMLNYPWKLGIIAQYIPKKIRNGLYRKIAKNRYRWFGKRKTCRIRTSELR